eukprot:494880-Rhodomonas_salina.2
MRGGGAFAPGARRLRLGQQAAAAACVLCPATPPTTSQRRRSPHMPSTRSTEDAGSGAKSDSLSRDLSVIVDRVAL